MSVPKAAPSGNNNKQVTFKNRVSFLHCITTINNTEIEIKCSDNYLKKSGKLWQQYRDETD